MKTGTTTRNASLSYGIMRCPVSIAWSIFRGGNLPKESRNNTLLSFLRCWLLILACLGCLTSDLRTIENNVQPKYHVAVVYDIHNVREGIGVCWSCHLGRYVRRIIFVWSGFSSIELCCSLELIEWVNNCLGIDGESHSLVLVTRNTDLNDLFVIVGHDLV